MKQPENLLSSTALFSFKEILTDETLKIILVFNSNSQSSILQHEYVIDSFDHSTDKDKVNISFLLSQPHRLITQQLKNIHGFFLNKKKFFHVIDNHFNLINGNELLFSIGNICHDTFPHINHFLDTGNIKFLPSIVN